MGIEGPNGTVNGLVLLVYGNRARNGEVFRVVRRGAGLHGATLGLRPSKDYSALVGNQCTSGRIVA
jgi:hypothetical protein